MGYLFQVLFLDKLVVDFFITWSLRMVEVGTDDIPDLRKKLDWRFPVQG